MKHKSRKRVLSLITCFFCICAMLGSVATSVLAAVTNVSNQVAQVVAENTAKQIEQLNNEVSSNNVVQSVNNLNVGSTGNAPTITAPSNVGTTVREQSGNFYLDSDKNGTQGVGEATVGADVSGAGLSDDTLLTTSATDNWLDVFMKYTSITLASDDSSVATISNGATATTEATFVIGGTTYTIHRNFNATAGNAKITITDNAEPANVYNVANWQFEIDGIQYKLNAVNFASRTEFVTANFSEAQGNIWKKAGKDGSYANPYTISNENEFAYFSMAFTIQGSSTDGLKSGMELGNKWFKLTANLNLGGRLWTPVASVNYNGNAFKTFFDGDNHTISGVYVNFDNNTQRTANTASVFGSWNNGIIRQVTIANANIVSGDVGAIVASYSFGDNTNNWTSFENVRVVNSRVTSRRCAAGMCNGGSYYIDCTMSHSEVLVYDHDETRINIEETYSVYGFGLNAKITNTGVNQLDIISDCIISADLAVDNYPVLTCSINRRDNIYISGVTRTNTYNDYSLYDQYDFRNVAMKNTKVNVNVNVGDCEGNQPSGTRYIQYVVTMAGFANLWSRSQGIIVENVSMDNCEVVSNLVYNPTVTDGTKNVDIKPYLYNQIGGFIKNDCSVQTNHTFKNLEMTNCTVKGIADIRMAAANSSAAGSPTSMIDSLEAINYITGLLYSGDSRPINNVKNCLVDKCNIESISKIVNVPNTTYRTFAYAFAAGVGHSHGGSQYNYYGTKLTNSRVNSYSYTDNNTDTDPNYDYYNYTYYSGHTYGFGGYGNYYTTDGTKNYGSCEVDNCYLGLVCEVKQYENENASGTSSSVNRYTSVDSLELMPLGRVGYNTSSTTTDVVLSGAKVKNSTIYGNTFQIVYAVVARTASSMGTLTIENCEYTGCYIDVTSIRDYIYTGWFMHGWSVTINGTVDVTNNKMEDCYFTGYAAAYFKHIGIFFSDTTVLGKMTIDGATVNRVKITAYSLSTPYVNGVIYKTNSLTNAGLDIKNVDVQNFAVNITTKVGGYVCGIAYISSSPIGVARFENCSVQNSSIAVFSTSVGQGRPFVAGIGVVQGSETYPEFENCEVTNTTMYGGTPFVDESNELINTNCADSTQTTACNVQLAITQYYNYDGTPVLDGGNPKYYRTFITLYTFDYDGFKDVMYSPYYSSGLVCGLAYISDTCPEMSATDCSVEGCRLLSAGGWETFVVGGFYYAKTTLLNDDMKCVVDNVDINNCEIYAHTVKCPYNTSSGAYVTGVCYFSTVVSQEVKNCDVENCSIIAESQQGSACATGVARAVHVNPSGGYPVKHASIDKCNVLNCAVVAVLTGDYSATTFATGIASYLFDHISNCVTSGVVYSYSQSGTAYADGIGWTTDRGFRHPDAWNQADRSQPATFITNCYNFATVIADTNSTAGGYADGIGVAEKFDSCVNYGNVYGTHVGGICAGMGSETSYVYSYYYYGYGTIVSYSMPLYIINCTNAGDVCAIDGGANKRIGGLVGYYNSASDPEQTKFVLENNVSIGGVYSGYSASGTIAVPGLEQRTGIAAHKSKYLTSGGTYSQKVSASCYLGMLYGFLDTQYSWQATATYVSNVFAWNDYSMFALGQRTLISDSYGSEKTYSAARFQKYLDMHSIKNNYTLVEQNGKNAGLYINKQSETDAYWGEGVRTVGGNNFYDCGNSTNGIYTRYQDKTSGLLVDWVDAWTTPGNGINEQLIAIQNTALDSYRVVSAEGIFYINSDFQANKKILAALYAYCATVDDGESYTDTARYNNKYDEGETVTVDYNGNGKWDAREKYSNVSSAYAERYPDYDHNKVRQDYDDEFTDVARVNGKYDYAEPYTDSNGNGRWDDKCWTYNSVTYTWGWDETAQCWFIDENGNGEFDGETKALYDSTAGKWFVDNNGDNVFNNKTQTGDNSYGAIWNGSDTWTVTSGVHTGDMIVKANDIWTVTSTDEYWNGKVIKLDNSGRWFFDANDGGEYTDGEPIYAENVQEHIADVEIGGESGTLIAAEPYADVNNNGRYDEAEEFTDTNSNGRYDIRLTFTNTNKIITTEDLTDQTVYNITGANLTAYAEANNWKQLCVDGGSFAIAEVDNSVATGLGKDLLIFDLNGNAANCISVMLVAKNAEGKLITTLPEAELLDAYGYTVGKWTDVTTDPETDFNVNAQATIVAGEHGFKILYAKRDYTEYTISFDPTADVATLLYNTNESNVVNSFTLEDVATGNLHIKTEYTHPTNKPTYAQLKVDDANKTLNSSNTKNFVDVSNVLISGIKTCTFDIADFFDEDFIKNYIGSNNVITFKGDFTVTAVYVLSFINANNEDTHYSLNVTGATDIALNATDVANHVVAKKGIVDGTNSVTITITPDTYYKLTNYSIDGTVNVTSLTHLYAMNGSTTDANNLKKENHTIVIDIDRIAYNISVELQNKLGATYPSTLTSSSLISGLPKTISIGDDLPQLGAELLKTVDETTYKFLGWKMAGMSGYINSVTADVLTYDVNNNGEFDSADGDTYVDINGNGEFDSALSQSYIAKNISIADTLFSKCLTTTAEGGTFQLIAVFQVQYTLNVNINNPSETMQSNYKIEYSDSTGDVVLDTANGTTYTSNVSLVIDEGTAVKIWLTPNNRVKLTSVTASNATNLMSEGNIALVTMNANNNITILFTEKTAYEVVVKLIDQNGNEITDAVESNLIAVITDTSVQPQGSSVNVPRATANASYVASSGAYAYRFLFWKLENGTVLVLNSDNLTIASGDIYQTNKFADENAFANYVGNNEEFVLVAVFQRQYQIIADIPNTVNYNNASMSINNQFAFSYNAVGITTGNTVMVDEGALVKIALTVDKKVKANNPTASTDETVEFGANTAYVIADCAKTIYFTFAVRDLSLNTEAKLVERPSDAIGTPDDTYVSALTGVITKKTEIDADVSKVTLGDTLTVGYDKNALDIALYRGLGVMLWNVKENRYDAVTTVVISGDFYDNYVTDDGEITICLKVIKQYSVAISGDNVVSGDYTLGTYAVEILDEGGNTAPTERYIVRTDKESYIVDNGIRIVVTPTASAYCELTSISGLLDNELATNGKTATLAVNGNRVVTVRFDKIVYSLKVSADAEATGELTYTNKFSIGDTITISYTPANNYVITDWTLNNAALAEFGATQTGNSIEVVATKALMDKLSQTGSLKDVEVTLENGISTMMSPTLFYGVIGGGALVIVLFAVVLFLAMKSAKMKKQKAEYEKKLNDMARKFNVSDYIKDLKQGKDGEYGPKLGM